MGSSREAQVEEENSGPFPPPAQDSATPKSILARVLQKLMFFLESYQRSSWRVKWGVRGKPLCPPWGQIKKKRISVCPWIQEADIHNQPLCECHSINGCYSREVIFIIIICLFLDQGPHLTLQGPLCCVNLTVPLFTALQMWSGWHFHATLSLWTARTSFLIPSLRGYKGILLAWPWLAQSPSHEVWGLFLLL